MKKRIVLVQQASWDNSMESIPLAIGYMKAVLENDADIADEIDVTLQNFQGGARLADMARAIFSENLPDVIGFSVLGWNIYQFGALAETFKQLNPDGLVVFGGNHVANQAERVFTLHSYVDVVVNGEGEITFRNIVAEVLRSGRAPDLSSIPGLSVRNGSKILTTREQERLTDLDVVPSPFLSGAIPMVNAKGEFRYDVALMETNRGCPYRCAFCYWGGAVGQKVRAFSRERLREELDMFGFYQVPTVCLCDANFGMLESDETFVEDLIDTFRRYGYPRGVETSWAKNKSARFHRIVTMLKEHGLKSSFTLSLQTLADDALTEMQRRNMKVNQWEPLVNWLSDEGLDCYAELIWGAPGETVSSFLSGYDRLAEKVSRIAIYPLMILPNTTYSQERERHGFVTVRGDADDFEYVLANKSASLTEHLRMQRFMLWARILSEHQFFRHVWRPLRMIAGMTQSGVIESVRSWFDASSTPAAAQLVDGLPAIADFHAATRALRDIYASAELRASFGEWWTTIAAPRFPVQWRDFVDDLYRFEEWSRPVYAPSVSTIPSGWSLVENADKPSYRSIEIALSYDIEVVLDNLASGDPTPPRPCPTTYIFQAPTGFIDNIENHEIAAYYVAEPVKVRHDRSPIAEPERHAVI
ncbi:KedN5 family methylcobalamin-dependent radical SAM C-methyltransferase [Antrihabitans spumae]|uniref:KedN5 family methylcobalamin-dependent radical SAM C-methyltransferase n=1 Tax=Antrihabitans spumae TaxID=3373370 RepID=A0ABW7KUP7_9NOCA